MIPLKFPFFSTSMFSSCLIVSLTSLNLGIGISISSAVLMPPIILMFCFYAVQVFIEVLLPSFNHFMVIHQSTYIFIPTPFGMRHEAFCGMCRVEFACVLRATQPLYFFTIQLLRTALLIPEKVDLLSHHLFVSVCMF